MKLEGAALHAYNIEVYDPSTDGWITGSTSTTTSSAVAPLPEPTRSCRSCFI